MNQEELFKKVALACATLADKMNFPDTFDLPYTVKTIQGKERFVRLTIVVEEIEVQIKVKLTP